MSWIADVALSGHGVSLLPMTLDHEDSLKAAAADGELWHIRVTSVPEPNQTRAYIETALAGKDSGKRIPFVVVNDASGDIVGSTSYHDTLADVRRVEIGYTWYAKRAQRTHVNTACKLLLMTHAFDGLDCNVVGWRTDRLNVASQRAIERLGAKKDGVIRGNALRRDGTIRDTVMYSLTRDEWPEVHAQLVRALKR